MFVLGVVVGSSLNLSPSLNFKCESGLGQRPSREKDRSLKLGLGKHCARYAKLSTYSLNLRIGLGDLGFRVRV